MEATLHYLRYILATLFVLGVVIVVHEFGHALVAKRLGMVVKEFSVGFGPRVLGWNWKGTRVVVRLVPLGGFVRIVGLEPEEWADPEGFYSKPLSSRAAVLTAGGALNLACAFALFTLVIWAKGVPEGGSRVVATVIWGSPAHRAGLREGDEIVGVNGRFYKDIGKIVEVIERSPGRKVVLLVRRGGRVMEVAVWPEPRWKHEVVGGSIRARRVGMIGVVFKLRSRRVGLWRAMAISAGNIGRIFLAFKFFFEGLKRLFRPESVVGGPITIVKEAGMQAQLGFSNLVLLAAAMSAFIGILNLLPFPALDGGRLLFVILAALRVRVHPRVEGRFHLVGFALLLILIVLLTAQDIWRLGQ